MPSPTLTIVRLCSVFPECGQVVPQVSGSLLPSHTVSLFRRDMRLAHVTKLIQSRRCHRVLQKELSLLDSRSAHHQGVVKDKRPLLLQLLTFRKSDRAVLSALSRQLLVRCSFWMNGVMMSPREGWRFLCSATASSSFAFKKSKRMLSQVATPANEVRAPSPARRESPESVITPVLVESPDSEYETFDDADDLNVPSNVRCGFSIHTSHLMIFHLNKVGASLQRGCSECKRRRLGL